ncbi:MAG: cupredoxin domain-containing protein [Ferrimicrobium sp.]|uniref:cupredoxin domain-containing protein n=1 Tax=Ferrimicrobium sp. TaxID=2926050 RepID=UPI002619F814|nr:cupredoxin domain-containing protein [Ferrimicrobium sp.]
MRQLRVMIFGAIVLLLGGLVLAACGSSAASVGASNLHPGPSASGKSATIVISNFQFIPDEVVVHQGEEIIIHNEDSVGHTFTADNRSFNTGVIPPGHTVHFIIHNKPGTYPFLCLIHQFMTGTLVVVK